MILSSDTDYLTSKDEEERGKRGRKGWHQADFTLGSRKARPRPLRPRKADQSARDQEKGKGGLKSANPRDKYILILLEYKLMLQLSGWTWSDCRDPFLF